MTYLGRSHGSEGRLISHLIGYTATFTHDCPEHPGVHVRRRFLTFAQANRWQGSLFRHYGGCHLPSGVS